VKKSFGIKTLAVAATLICAGGSAFAAAVPNPSHRWTFDDYTNGSTIADTGTTPVADATPYQVTESSDVPSKLAGDTKSASFDGGGSILIEQPITADFTICAWIKTTSSGGVNHWESAPIFDSEVPGGALDYGFGIGDGGQLMYGSGGYDPSIPGSTDIIDVTIRGNTVVNDNAWHNVCVTRVNSSGLATFYVDGGVDGSGVTTTSIPNENTQAQIGYGFDGAAQYVGLIDDVRIYSSALTAADIATIANGDVALQSLAKTGGDFVGVMEIGGALVLAGAVTLIRRRKF